MRNRSFSATKFYLDKLSEEHNVVFPSFAYSTEFTRKMDLYFNQRSAINMSRLFSNPKKYFNLSYFEYLSKQLSKRRRLREKDRVLVGKLCEIEKKSHEFYLIDFLGVFAQIENIYNETNKSKLTPTLKATLLLWLFLNIAEATSSLIATLLYRYAKSSNDKKFVDEYDGRRKKGEHIEFGKLKNHIVRMSIISQEDKTIFDLNYLRRQIAHGTIFYDKRKKKFMLRGEKPITFSFFRKELSYMYQFYSELLFRLNKSDAEIYKRVLSDLEVMAGKYRWLERSHLKKSFTQLSVKQLQNIKVNRN